MTTKYGMYKVALFVDQNSDYHWYRQNADGSWSQKMGGGIVTNKEGTSGTGNIILDPEAVDIDEGGPYETSVAYFAISASTAHMCDLPEV